MSFKVTFHNFNYSSDFILPKDNKNKILKIEKILNSLPALNIVKNKKLLDETIEIVKDFAREKTCFVVFGTGGSNLGSKALINILLSNEKIKIYFFDNIDPISFSNSISKIDIFKAGFIVISKSGSTPETLSQFSSVIEIFEQKRSKDILFKNSLIITEKNLNPLYNIAKTNKCRILHHENDIGGRYSIFSNVGMVPAIITGLDVKKIHEGALEETNKISDHEYLKLPQFFHHQKTNNSLNSTILMTYSDALYFFGKWYLQLWAESLGKNKKAITAIHSVGTTDQHSQLQLYLDGPKDKFFTFITTNHSNKGFKMHSETMQNYDIKYLANKTMGDLMHAEQQAIINTFKENKFIFRQINLEKIDEFTIGKLMALSIMETIATCIYFEADPFNQPAVEQSKILTKKYLS